MLDMSKIIESYAAFVVRRGIQEYESRVFFAQAYAYLPDPDAPAAPYVEPVYETDDLPDIVLVIEPAAVVRKCLCSNIVGVRKVCLRTRCTFAHNADEWAPEACKFSPTGHYDKRLRRFVRKCRELATCNRLHGAETKDQALARLGVVLLPPKKYAQARSHIMAAVEFKRQQPRK